MHSLSYKFRFFGQCAGQEATKGVRMVTWHAMLKHEHKGSANTINSSWAWVQHRHIPPTRQMYWSVEWHKCIHLDAALMGRLQKNGEKISMRSHYLGQGTVNCEDPHREERNKPKWEPHMNHRETTSNDFRYRWSTSEDKDRNYPQKHQDSFIYYQNTQK